MGERTGISWTDHTFNPWMGCFKVSAGCKICYAETLTKRWGAELWGPPEHTTRRVTAPAYWRKPHIWNREAQRDFRSHRVFCGSLCDVFEDHPTANEVRPLLFELIRATWCLDWQLLTKRPENIERFLPDDWGRGWPNVWLGTSIEDMRVADRAHVLRSIPAVVRFISYEPALGPLDDLGLTGIDWVIYGGESGPGHRPHDLQWARSMRDRCRDLGVAFFYKQGSGPRPGMYASLDGEVGQAFPNQRR